MLVPQEIYEFRKQRKGTSGRRFCSECSQLRFTYYTKRNAQRSDPHYCTPCAVKLGVDTTRNSF